MKRRQLLIGGGAAAAGLLAGCIGRAQEQPPSTNPERSSTITVSDSGEVSAEPDMAIIRAGVEASGEDAATVRDDLSSQSDALRTALIEFGVPDENITTSQFRIRERPPTRSGPDEERPSVFEGVHRITIEVDDVDDTGPVVDAAVDGGADVITSVQFTLSPERQERLRNEALELAIANARSDAELIASEVDGRITGIKSIDAADGRVRPVRADVAVAADVPEAPGTEFHPDEVTVTADVRIVYYLDGA